MRQYEEKKINRKIRRLEKIYKDTEIIIRMKEGQHI